jgi:hypothetical protein
MELNFALKVFMKSMKKPPKKSLLKKHLTLELQLLLKLQIGPIDIQSFSRQVDAPMLLQKV